MSGNRRRSDYEEYLLKRIIETDGIKKIQDAISAVIYGKDSGGTARAILVTTDGKLIASLG